ncbi:MAG: gamma carbonic anhydrase family protein [Thermodesulfobacteriota bacterium]|nr:gamma carbonic anhydrase family protein [Thermodesulfobacteriota bacterium]
MMNPSTSTGRKHPVIHESVFIARGARIFGEVSIAEGASVWFNAVMRADEGAIEIGEDCNIQDNVVIHSDMGTPAIIGRNVTIGHGAVIRACRINEDVMIGMNSTIMSNAEIGAHSIVGANTFVPYNKTFPPNVMIMGTPAKVIRDLTDKERAFNRMAIETYKDLARQYQAGEITGISGL